MNRGEAGVSVLMAVYNGEKYLREAIDSVLGQSRPPLELIVVDDGSTDRTPEILAGYGAALRSARQANAGAAVALNHGIGLARGGMLGFIDADDLWLPRKLELQLEAMRREPAPELVFGHVRQFISPELSEAERAKILCPPEPMPGKSHLTLLIRREALERVGLFEPSLRMAWSIDWLARADELRLRSVMLPEPLALRRLHSDNQGLREAARRGDYARAIKRALDRRRAAGGQA